MTGPLNPVTDWLEKIPFHVRALATEYTPSYLHAFVINLVNIIPVLGISLFLFAVLMFVERKGMARIQNRLGPNRVGPFGMFQPAADAIKLMLKEDIVPVGGDRFVHNLAPIALVVPAFLLGAFIPYGKYWVPAEFPGGVLFFFAITASSELSIFMAGWSSRNKYSLLGAMRAIAQMVSYEIPLIMAALPAVMLVGSLSTARIVEHQSGYLWGVVPHWHVFTPWGFVGFLIFMIGAMAESNRSPFDLPEAESELIAGHLTEYTGFKYATFFMAEYLFMIAISGMSVTLYLGGWHAPAPWLEWIPSWLWFFVKLCALLWCFIWIRATVPRLRVDQLMALAWKLMLPMTLLNIVVAGVWHFSAGWSFPAALPARWLLAAALLLGPYILLSRLLARRRPASRRIYRFADA